MNRVDISLFKDQEAIKTWYISETIDGVTSDYDLTLKTVVIKVFDRQDPPVLIQQLSPSNRGLGFVTFTLGLTITSSNVPVDYIIYEDLGGELKNLSYGTLSFLPLANYIAFREMVTNEIPGNMVIPESFITIKSFEWRLLLQNAIEPNILDEDVQNELAWPTLVNFLIAKLVVNDYITKQLKQLLGSSTESDQSTGTGVKRIETGPAVTEFHDSMKSLGDLLKVGSNGQTPLDSLKKDICILAGKLRINLPHICGELSNRPVIPIKVERELPLTTEEFLNKYYTS